MLPLIPKGLLEPALSCSAIRCIKTRAANTKGNIKCKAKNLFRVALPTEKPPQITVLLSIKYLALFQHLAALFRLCLQPFIFFI